MNAIHILLVVCPASTVRNKKQYATETLPLFRGFSRKELPRIGCFDVRSAGTPVDHLHRNDRLNVLGTRDVGKNCL